MKNILIVGGTKGIGLAITQQLITEQLITEQLITEQVAPIVWARSSVDIVGAKVIVNDVTSAQIDLVDLPDVLDGVVYCPGSITLKPFARLSADDFMNDWQLNFFGAVKVLQLVQQRLKKSPAPSVVLFSSVAAGLGMPFHASIASAKAAVEGLTKSLAAEWAPHIRVNAIAPSLTNTPLAEKFFSSDEKIEAASKKNPLQKLGKPEDLAALACFLLSEKASWITGQVMQVDGGMANITR
jgi:3-oxoacyl-[acyl-carrier protein] reductase